MANRIKDTLSPELYEYYKNHRNKYKRFASDLTLLQAKLFKGMVDDKVFPTTKKRHGWEYECDCTTWLNGATSKITTFNDFRKLYKDRLKNYKFKSPEYYDECERIVSENDVEYARNAMRAQSMRNYVARNYNAPMTQEEQPMPSLVSIHTNQIYPVKAIDVNVVAESALNMLKPIEENQEKLKNIASQGRIIQKDDFEYAKFIFAAILSFFVFGCIAYVFKHLLALVVYLFGYLSWCAGNIINSIGAILFNYNVETLPLDTSCIPEPFQIWQIGGWIYGAFVVVVICVATYYKIKNLVGE